MSNNNDKGRQALKRLTEAFVDDILELSDAEVLAEFTDGHGDPDTNAVQMRALFEKAVIASNKRHLKAAQVAVAAEQRNIPTIRGTRVIAAAREQLRQFLASGIVPPVTVAARKESELSDADVLGMLEDLRELGVLPPDSDSERQR